MRHLVLLLLVACENPKPAPHPVVEVKPAVAPVPTVTVPTVTAPPPTNDPFVNVMRCAVGDGTHVAIYDFFERELADAARHDKGRAAARKLLAKQAELEKQPDMKPLRASISESSTSHALSAMCRGTDGCKGAALYTKSGIAIAMTTEMPLGFDDAQWARLTKASEGEIVDGYIVIPSKHGLALCK